MSERFEIRFAGSGGQGVILAAVVTGEAAALYENVFAVQSQAYGPEARGGASKSEVVISHGQIDYPKATQPDLQVILTQKACEEYAHDTKRGGTIILDDFYVSEAPSVEAEIFMLPIARTAKEKLGKEMVTNMVALGATARILELAKVVQPESVKRAILARVPKGTEKLNEQAFEEGYAMMKEKK
jgi:2-oxoglutarate ferredoxin oxidoreductase subunit gamma